MLIHFERVEGRKRHFKKHKKEHYRPKFKHINNYNKCVWTKFSVKRQKSLTGILKF